MPAPLSITLDTTGAQTALPLFLDGSTVRAIFKEVKQDKNDNGDFLIFQFASADPAPSQGGRTINQGFPIFKRVYLYDKETPKGTVPERAKSDVARIQDACLGTGDKDNPKGKPERPALDGNSIPDMIGKEVFITFKVKPDKNGVDQNEIAKLQHPSDLAA